MNSEDQEQVAKQLAKLEPGFLPFDIFQQVARLVALPIVEIVPLHTNQQGETEVLLLERAPDDPHFPGQLHAPGVVVLSTDTAGSFADAFDRIVNSELAGTHTAKPTYVYHLLHRSARGMELAHVYWAAVLGPAETGTFYAANALPQTLIASQREFIAEAVRHYESTKRH